MGNVAGYRAACIDAAEYIKKTEKDKKKDSDKPDSDKDTGGKRDLKLDTLAAATQGDILVHIHCYRAAELTTMLDLPAEFGFKVAAFHHSPEERRVGEEGVSTGSQRWSPEN